MEELLSETPILFFDIKFDTLRILSRYSVVTRVLIQTYLSYQILHKVQREFALSHKKSETFSLTNLPTYGTVPIASLV